MRKIITAITDQLEKIKATSAVELKSWSDIHLAKLAANTMADAAAVKIAAGWDELEASCNVADIAKAESMGAAAAEKIAHGMDELSAACEAEDDLEAKALFLAKGDAHVRRMHGYMRPTKVRSRPLI